MVCFKGICDEMFYGVRKHMLFIIYLADLVFIGLSVFSFDELEFLSSYGTWKNALFFTCCFKLYSAKPAFHCSSEAFLNSEASYQN